MIENLNSLRARFTAQDSSFFTAVDDGDPRRLRRLSLEQQKKLAKELLRQWRDSADAETQSLQLADAQKAIARQHGFNKWTDLKAHIERMDVSHLVLELKQPPALDGDHRALHIRCGSDIQHAMVVAGFSGDFLVFADPYVHGPVPETETLGEFIEARATYISSDGRPNFYDALKHMRGNYAALDSARDYDAVYMWSEHDSYDQLICAKLLDYFSNKSNRPPSVKMINIMQFAGVEKFNGIGQLPPVAMRELWTEFDEVTDPQYLLGREAWRAIRSGTPELLQQLVETGMPDLPVMVPALDRHLKQLPSKFNGLNLSESLALEILRDNGAMTAAKLFGWYTNNYEPLPFMGDTGFWHQLEDLADARQPAIQLVKEGERPTQWRTSLTDVGVDLLKGRLDWLELNDIDRWVGGIHIDTVSGEVFRV